MSALQGRNGKKLFPGLIPVKLELPDIGKEAKGTPQAVGKSDDVSVTWAVFIDELAMVKRPDVSPGKSDREVFAKRLPKSILSEEQLRSWIRTDFGPFEQLLVLKDDFLTDTDSNVYIRFERHDTAELFLIAQGGDGEQAIWSEAERAAQRSKSVYGSDIHAAFLGEDGDGLRRIMMETGASQLWMQGEVQEPIGEGIPPEALQEPYAPQLHFSVTCNSETLEKVKIALAEVLEAYHDRTDRLLRCYGGGSKEKVIQQFDETTGDYVDVKVSSDVLSDSKDGAPVPTIGKNLVWDSATGKYLEEDLPEEIQDLICVSGPATSQELQNVQQMVKVKQELAAMEEEQSKSKGTPETPLHQVAPGTQACSTQFSSQTAGSTRAPAWEEDHSYAKRARTDGAYSHASLGAVNSTPSGSSSWSGWNGSQQNAWRPKAATGGAGEKSVFKVLFSQTRQEQNEPSHREQWHERDWQQSHDWPKQGDNQWAQDQWGAEAPVPEWQAPSEEITTESQQPSQWAQQPEQQSQQQSWNDLQSQQHDQWHPPQQHEQEKQQDSQQHNWSQWQPPQQHLAQQPEQQSQQQSWNDLQTQQHDQWHPPQQHKQESQQHWNQQPERQQGQWQHEEYLPEQKRIRLPLPLPRQQSSNFQENQQAQTFSQHHPWGQSQQLPQAHTSVQQQSSQHVQPDQQQFYSWSSNTLAQQLEQHQQDLQGQGASPQNHFAQQSANPHHSPQQVTSHSVANLPAPQFHVQQQQQVGQFTQPQQFAAMHMGHLQHQQDMQSQQRQAPMQGLQEQQQHQQQKQMQVQLLQQQQLLQHNLQQQQVQQQNLLALQQQQQQQQQLEMQKAYAQNMAAFQHHLSQMNAFSALGSGTM